MTDDHAQQIGFVGLGDQGGPMAVAIAEAGFSLHAWARNPASYEVLSDVAYARHADLAGLAGHVDMLALCLRDDGDIDALIERNCLLEALRPGVIVVNHGTGDPKGNERFGALFATHDVHFLDAPVSGGRPGAVARTLTTIVGGDRAAFDRCRPVFESFSRKVAHMGPVGTGQLTKLLNNALTMTNLKNAADVFGYRWQTRDRPPAAPGRDCGQQRIERHPASDRHADRSRRGRPSPGPYAQGHRAFRRCHPRPRAGPVRPAQLGDRRRGGGGRARYSLAASVGRYQAIGGAEGLSPYGAPAPGRHYIALSGVGHRGHCKPARTYAPCCVPMQGWKL